MFIFQVFYFHLSWGFLKYFINKHVCACDFKVSTVFFSPALHVSHRKNKKPVF